MSLSVNINYKANISELVERYDCFTFLENANISKEHYHEWCINNGHEKESIYQIQVMIIGKTGYGKSTTLNSIVGHDVFKSDDIEICTKKLYSMDYKIKNNYYLSFADLPGIGESIISDSRYFEWYRDMQKKSCCILYVLRADQRDYTLDKILFESMFDSNEERDKVIIALNYADKIEPINRSSNLSIYQIMNLHNKKKEISIIFKIPMEKIVYYSAKENININSLVEKVSESLVKIL